MDLSLSIRIRFFFASLLLLLLLGGARAAGVLLLMIAVIWTMSESARWFRRRAQTGSGAHA